jgi:DNA-binding response OmpR family regulator
MIVEDSKDTVDMIRKLLESEKFDVLPFYNGIDALDYLNNIKDDEIPDLVILDMFMPKMNGREVAQRIRDSDNPDIRDVRIVFFTVAAFQDYGLKILSDLNVLDYIAKPFDMEDFLKRIRVAIDK